MTTTLRFAAAGALALALAACGAKSKPDPYLENIPDAAALTIDTSASAAPSAAMVAGAVTFPDPEPVTTAGDDLAVVHRKAQAMNDAIRDVFAHVGALTASGGTQLAGSVKQWGPAVRCVEPDGAGGCVADGEAKLVLRARRWSDHLGDFVVLATSVAGSDWKPVLAGYLMRGGMEHRGAGKLWVNHENLFAAAPGFRGRGYLAAGFAAGPVAKAVNYRLIGFTRDLDKHAPVTAAFSGWKNGAGVVRARVADLGATNGAGDLYHPSGQPSLSELGLWRGVWAAGLGGRAFTVITGGDVATGKFWFGRACYPAGSTTPSYKEWFECDKGTHTELVLGASVSVPNGPAYCVRQNAGAGEPDPSIVTAGVGPQTWQETTCFWSPAQHAGEVEPDEVGVPTLEPRDANDDRDEDGASHVGLTPEPCPSTATAIQTPEQTPPGMNGPGMSGPGMGGMM